MGDQTCEPFFDYEEARVVTTKGPRAVLVMTPRTRLRAGRQRLLELKRSADYSPIDDECLRQVRRRRGRIRALLFRGRSDDEAGSWGFGDDLSPDEERELAALLVRSMNLTRRRLIAAGVLVHVHTDFTFRDVELLKRATEQVIEELEADLARRAPSAATPLSLDLWALKHLTFYFTLPVAKVLASVLTDKLPILEQRQQRLKELLAQLPAEPH